MKNTNNCAPDDETPFATPTNTNMSIINKTMDTMPIKILINNGE